MTSVAMQSAAEVFLLRSAGDQPDIQTDESGVHSELRYTAVPDSVGEATTIMQPLELQRSNCSEDA
jgi:hypothetical protein